MEKGRGQEGEGGEERRGGRGQEGEGEKRRGGERGEKWRGGNRRERGEKRRERGEKRGQEGEGENRRGQEGEERRGQEGEGEKRTGGRRMGGRGEEDGREREGETEIQTTLTYQETKHAGEEDEGQSHSSQSIHHQSASPYHLNKDYLHGVRGQVRSKDNEYTRQIHITKLLGTSKFPPNLTALLYRKPFFKYFALICLQIMSMGGGGGGGGGSLP